MAPKKLTEADKTSILSLYRQPQETTSTLADRYGVSNSTISRLLKASLPEAEYSLLIQQKRSTSEKAVPSALVEPEIVPQAKPRGRKKAGATLVDAEAIAVELPGEAPTPIAEVAPPVVPKAKPRSKKKAEPQPEPAIAAPAVEASDSVVEALPPVAIAKPARRRRSQSEAPLASEAADAPAETAVAASTPEPTQLTLPDPEPATTPAKPARPVLKSAQTTAPETLAATLDDDDDADDWDSPVLGDDYDDDDGDDGDDDGETIYPWEGDSPVERLHRHGATPALESLEISPLTADVLPSLCYVVVERTSSELVVLPLRTFAELGQIPEAEGDSRTLPVFENHNVARRFSRRNQRVVKVPDGTLLQTTSPYLQAKGITRLFIDGQIFSLGDDLSEPVAVAVDE